MRRFLPESWRWAATLRGMKTRQTVMVVTIREDSSDRAEHLAARLRSICAHPQYRDLVNFTVEDFPQAPPVPEDHGR